MWTRRSGATPQACLPVQRVPSSGSGCEWHKGQVLHTPAEALSLTAFQGGVRRSVDNTKGFDSFLPLSLSPEHHSRAFADAAVHQQVRNLARQCKLMDCSVVLPDTALDTGCCLRAVQVRH